MNPEDLCFTPATELARAVRDKRLSPVEITEAMLGRIEALNPKVNAYCTPTPEIALEQARRAEQAVMNGDPLGPVHGVPYSVKDLLITKGVRTMRGSHIYAEWVPEEDAPIVERLRDAGGIMLGKTTTPEFGWKGMTDSPLTGITRNPWNTELTPGGSSGGASAQVAAGLGPLALGTDGGGSIRIPCSFTNLYGIKPSFGRVPTYPGSGFDGLACTGPLTRTVADSALMLHVIAGPHDADRFSLECPPEDYLARLDEGIKGWRVAWSPTLGYASVDHEVAEICAEAARAFEETGCSMEEVVDPGFDDPTPFFGVFWQAGVAGMIADYLPQWRERMDPGLVHVAESGTQLSALDFAKAQIARHAFYDRVRRFFDRYDLLITPTVSIPPFKAGEDHPREIDGHPVGWMQWTPFTYPFNVSQHPAASVPAGFTADGRPVGLQIVGRRHADLAVLQASAAFEAVRPWAQHRPAL